MIDAKALETVMRKHQEEKLAKELREFFVMGAPPEYGQIYTLYLREVERRRLRRIDRWYQAATIALVGLIALSFAMAFIKAGS
jgi:hypothetical protein